MKKLYLISAFILLILLVASTSIYATNTTINPKGSNSVTLGSTNKITLQLTSSSKIGGVMGIIEKSSNISDIRVTAKNGWNIMSYNEETGSFNMVKNEGAKNEEIMEIEYTVSNAEGTGKITIKNITVSDIENYEEETLDNVSKEIAIVKKQEEPEQHDSEKDSNTGNETSKDNITIDTEQRETKPDNNQITGKSGNTTNNKSVLPYAGVFEVFIPIIVLILGGISIGTYLGYKKYKGVK